MDTHSPQLGVVTSVRGSVVDVRFDGALPMIHTVLHAGEGDRIVIEVLTRATRATCAASR